MKSLIEIKDRIAQETEILNDLINEEYKPNTPQLSNIFCICSSIESLKWVISDYE